MNFRTSALWTLILWNHQWTPHLPHYPIISNLSTPIPDSKFEPANHHQSLAENAPPAPTLESQIEFSVRESLDAVVVWCAPYVQLEPHRLLLLNSSIPCGLVLQRVWPKRNFGFRVTKVQTFNGLTSCWLPCCFHCFSIFFSPAACQKAFQLFPSTHWPDQTGQKPCHQHIASAVFGMPKVLKWGTPKKCIKFMRKNLDAVYHQIWGYHGVPYL